MHPHYPELAGDLLRKARRRGITTLEKIASKPLPAETTVLEFTVYWNGYFPMSVSVYPRDAAGDEVSDRRPYGELFELSWGVRFRFERGDLAFTMARGNLWHRYFFPMG